MNCKPAAGLAVLALEGMFASGASVAAPAPAAPPNPCLRLSTDAGAIAIELSRAAAPAAVAAIERLARGPVWNPAVVPEPAAAARTGYFDGLAFDHVRPRLEIRVPVREPAAAFSVATEIDAAALGLDRERVADAGEAMERLQMQLLPALTRPSSKRVATPTLADWAERFAAERDPGFLIGKSRQELLEAIGHRYRSGLASLPPTRGAVLLVPASPTTSTISLAVLLADHPARRGLWMAVGRVVAGLEVADAISLGPLADVAARDYRPTHPVVIRATPANCFVFDPRVLYTQAFNRFVLFALVRDDVNLRSYLFFAVSQTSDPLGSWWLYFSFDPVNTDTWVDYSGMSADPWGVYFTGNEFFWAGGYKHSIILSVRPDVFSGAWNGAWIFWDLRWNEAGNPLAFELQPAVPSHGFPGDQATFFVNTFNFSGDKACVWKLTGDRGSSPTLVRNSVPVQPYADPGLAHQPDPGADDIEMFYAGAQNVAYSQRKVYLALNDAGTGQSGFYVSKVDVDGLVEDRNISYYTGGFYYYYPNVMLYGLDSVNPLVALAMSYSSDADFPSGAFKVYENFMVDSSGDFWQAGAGAATYNVYFNGRNRWGDYMGVARDHSCDTVWAVTEYSPLTNVWRTRIAAMAGDQALPLSCRLIFDDGFEIGNTLNWSSVAP